MISSRKFLQSVNLLNLSSDPTGGSSGDLYFNTTTETIRMHNGANWSNVSTSGAGGTSFVVSEDAPSTPTIGDGWFDNVNSNLYIYDGTFWQEVSSTLIVDLVQDTTPELGGDLDANGYGLDNVDSIDFDTTTTTPSSEGAIVWDSGEGTLSLGLSGGNISLDIGQENVVLCYNGTGSTMTIGQVVYISGAQGQRPSITLSDASTDPASSKTLGLVAEEIADGTEGFVTTFGVVKSVDTFGFTEGNSLWLSTTAGEYTETKPTQPDHAVFIGYCLKASATAGRIFVNPQNGYEIEELHNVLITSPSNGQVISYNSSTGLWENTDQSGGTGTASVTVSETAPSSPNEGDAWFDNVNGDLYIYDGTFWQEAVATIQGSTLPDQTGNSGKYLTTDGTDLSWSTVSSGGGTWGSITGTLSDQTDLQSALDSKSPLASPTFTGTPAAPTATEGTNTTQLATTEFVTNAVSGISGGTSLPTQTGNSGKVLSTNGTDPYWKRMSGLSNYWYSNEQVTFSTTNGGYHCLLFKSDLGSNGGNDWGEFEFSAFFTVYNSISPSVSTERQLGFWGDAVTFSQFGGVANSWNGTVNSNGLNSWATAPTSAMLGAGSASESVSGADLDSSAYVRIIPGDTRNYTHIRIHGLVYNFYPSEGSNYTHSFGLRLKYLVNPGNTYIAAGSHYVVRPI